MFITNEDYAVLIGDDALKVLSRASEENRAIAMLQAIEEVSGYLRPVYDCDSVFSAEGNDRNMLIVMRTADIALYHLAASLPQRMGFEIRKERYDRAIEWLEGVQAGRIVPDLPRARFSGDASFGTSFHSAPKLNHDW